MLPPNHEYDNKLLRIQLRALIAERDALAVRVESHRKYIAELTAKLQRLTGKGKA